MKSRDGRDKERVLIVVEVIDEHYVHVADGDLRKLEKPKKKKVKHLNKLDLVSAEVKDKALSDMKLNNALLRKEVEKAGLI